MTEPTPYPIPFRALADSTAMLFDLFVEEGERIADALRQDPPAIDVARLSWRSIEAALPHLRQSLASVDGGGQPVVRAVLTAYRTLREAQDSDLSMDDEVQAAREACEVLETELRRLAVIPRMTPTAEEIAESAVDARREAA